MTDTAGLPRKDPAADNLRKAFRDAVDAYGAWHEGPEPTVPVNGAEVPISAVCKLLWKCVEALPGDVWQALQDNGMRAGSYAGAARLLKSAITHRQAG